MGKIKLLKLAKELGVGVASLTEALKVKGFEVENNPNARIGSEEFDVLLSEFVKNKEDRNKITRLFLKDAGEGQTAKTEDASKKHQETSKPKEIKEEDKTLHGFEKPRFKVVDKIDLNPKKKISQPEIDKPVSAENALVQETKELSNVNEIQEVSKRISQNSVKSKEEPKLVVEKKPEEVVSKHDQNDQISGKEKVLSETSSQKPEDSTSKESVSIKHTYMEPHKQKEGNEKKEQDLKDKEEKPVHIPGSVDQSQAPDLPIVAPTINGPKVVGSIDLAQFKDDRSRGGRNERKKGKRARTTTSGQHVNVAEEIKKASSNNKGAKANKNTGNQKGTTSERVDVKPNVQNGQQRTAQQQSKNNVNASKKAGKRQREREKVSLTQEEIDKAVKENLARLTNKSTETSRAAKRRKDKRDARNAAVKDAMSQPQEQTIQLTEFVTVSDLATLMDVQVNEVIKTCMEIGLMVNINQRLEADTINLVAEEFGFKTEFVSADVVEAIENVEEDDEPENLVERPPIVTVMGHVDHGKTSLLDRIRNTNVIAGEAGGITQHIGAYNLTLGNGKHITFLDTPGHEAFTAMRARGAKVTDIAIIIVAADDSVMPQTKEAINHASAAGVPIVFAINKVDKPSANPDKIKEELAAMNYLVEDWGGRYQCQEISAKKGLNIERLLEKVLLEAELLELKANPKRNAMGSIIESSLDKGRGYVATVLVQNGTLKVGDTVLAGTHYGRVKAMFNERNQRVKEAGPSVPVLVLGLNGAPTAGDNFHVLDSEQEARNIATKREQLQREQDNRMKKGLTLDELARRKALGNFQELNLIIKGDVDGSVEALADSLVRLSTPEIQVNVIHKGVGQISESDVVLASASSAIIIGFQVRPSGAARKSADQEGVEIRTYSIIYDTIEDVKSAMEGMLSPDIKEQITANLEVLQTFKVSKVGTIAGCMVSEGKIKRTNKIRLIRDGIVKYAGELGSLKRYKDDAKEVVAGQECGLNIEGYNDIQVGDIIEAYEEIEIKKTLD